jgi:hypothetical protein
MYKTPNKSIYTIQTYPIQKPINYIPPQYPIIPIQEVLPIYQEIKYQIKKEFKT